jgi:hypothetical protein
LNKLAHLIAKFASEEPALVLLTLPSALLRFFPQMVSSSIKMKAATPALTNVETEPSPRREEPVIRHNKRGQRSLTPAKLFDSASMSDDEYKPASEEEEDSDFEVELHVTNTTAIQPKKTFQQKFFGFEEFVENQHDLDLLGAEKKRGKVGVVWAIETEELRMDASYLA